MIKKLQQKERMGESKHENGDPAMYVSEEV
jgi:hypothetical protein